MGAAEAAASRVSLDAIVGQLDKTFTERLPDLIGKALPDPGEPTQAIRIGGQVVQPDPAGATAGHDGANDPGGGCSRGRCGDGRRGGPDRPLPAPVDRGDAVHAGRSVHGGAGRDQRHRRGGGGDFSFPESWDLIKQLASQVKEDVTHPFERGGFLAADILGAAASGRAGLAAQGWQAGRSETGVALPLPAGAGQGRPADAPHDPDTGDGRGQRRSRRRAAPSAAAWSVSMPSAVGPGLTHDVPGRIGFELERTRRIESDVERPLPRQLLRDAATRLGRPKKLMTEPKQTAVRIWASNLSPDQWRAMFDGETGGGDADRPGSASSAGRRSSRSLASIWSRTKRAGWRSTRITRSCWSAERAQASSRRSTNMAIQEGAITRSRRAATAEAVAGSAGRPL